MSYCRFSSDSFSCDAYVWHGVSGYVVALASSRVRGDIPQVDPADLLNDPGKYFADNQRLMEFVREAEFEAIRLPYAGESFAYQTARACAEALEGFREIGYRIPQYAIDALREEARNES